MKNNTVKLGIFSEKKEYLMNINKIDIPSFMNRVTISYAGEIYDFISRQDEKKGLQNFFKKIDITYDNNLLQIPAFVSKKIVQYLQNPKQRDNCDCHDFIDLVAKNLSCVFTEQQYQENYHYNAGSISTIKNINGEVPHSQLYLGKGLFLGKMGIGGPLMISNASTQKNLWGGDYTVIYPL